MTPAQFAALAALAGMLDSPSRRAAELVLVHGLSQAQAALQAAITVQGVSQALQRIKRAQGLIAAAQS